MNPSTNMGDNNNGVVVGDQYPIDKRPISCFTSNGYYGYSMIYPTENETPLSTLPAPAVPLDDVVPIILPGAAAANDIQDEMMSEQEHDDNHHHQHHHQQLQQQQQQQLVIETRKRTLQNNYHCDELLKRTRFENCAAAVPSEQLLLPIMANNYEDNEKMDSLDAAAVLDVEIIRDNYFNIQPMISSPPTYQIENHNHNHHQQNHIDSISSRCNMKFPIYD